MGRGERWVLLARPVWVPGTHGGYGHFCVRAPTSFLIFSAFVICDMHIWTIFFEAPRYLGLLKKSRFQSKGSDLAHIVVFTPIFT